jgi:hypothetical protein
LDHLTRFVQVVHEKSRKIPRIPCGSTLAPKLGTQGYPHAYRDEKKKNCLNALNHTIYFFNKENGFLWEYQVSVDFIRNRIFAAA